MNKDIVIPAIGESITQVTIGAILKPTGTSVHLDEELLELETEKLNQPIYAPADGVVHLQVTRGQECAIGEVIGWVEEKAVSAVPTPAVQEEGRTQITPLSTIRKAICKRLKEAQFNSVMLTTFAEVDMSAIIALRTKHQEAFQREHQVKLGFMSLFVKASCIALEQFPMANSYIEGENFVTRNYFDIAVAIASERGLVVPIIRNANSLTFAQIEKTILNFRKEADSGQLTASSMKGGSFTISNGGVFGSLLSTPILNPPQSAILGMHSIVDRAVVRDGQIVARPMMYLALTYDHCVLDGKEAVLFLNAIKKLLEEPTFYE